MIKELKQIAQLDPSEKTREQNSDLSQKCQGETTRQGADITFSF